MLFDGWMKEQIIYKHVKRRLPGNTGRNTPGFDSSCNRSQRNRGPYKTQRAAAWASCQYLDIPLSKCKRSKNMEKCLSQSFTSQYRYVYYNKRRRKWFGQHGRYQDSFISKSYSVEHDEA